MKAARAGLVEGFGPGFRHLIDHLRASPCGANCNDGVWRLPGGDVSYAAQLRWNTTLPPSPAEVHRIGLEETERPHGELRAVMRAAGIGRASFGDIGCPYVSIPVGAVYLNK